MAPARLISISISHFCEKARWVLDFTGVEYREEPYAPIAHRRATRAVGGTTVTSARGRLATAVERDGYLVARRFTLADLTLAALASPLLGPPEHPINGRARKAPAPGLAALRAELTEIVGRQVLRMYREHRAPVLHKEGRQP